MCGVHALISSGSRVEPSQCLTELLCNRGPDHLGQATRTVPSPDGQGPNLTLSFTSTVLALRGDHVAKQPFEDSASGSVLCWNGEAWKIGGRPVHGNDGEEIFSLLMRASSPDAERRKHRILTTLRSIQGPFAFLYYDAPGKYLYFGRDRLGRRSLLINKAAGHGPIALSSVADSRDLGWSEVQADGIYSMHLDATTIDRLSYTKEDWLVSGAADLISGIGQFNMSLPEGKELPDIPSHSIDLLRQHLTESLRLRILNVPKPPSIPDPGCDVDVRIAVLFSGGLDCTLVARLAHEVLPLSQGIDLINVAFQSARDAAANQDDGIERRSQVYEACPDRITGRKAVAELRSSCPSRWWRFIAVNVPFTETMAHRPRVVSLMYPHNTEMDLSIALALYFASRGVGNGCTDDHSNRGHIEQSVTTPARVLLSGLGADELFGGYSRHEVAFKRNGYAGLIDELKLDVSRIGERNLGRDDRILSHWGKEVRFPYLDEDFIRFSIECPVWEKCDFSRSSHPAGIESAKRALRLLSDQLGIPSTAREKKRAIQFGARTAKIERTAGGLKTKGTDIIS